MTYLKEKGMQLKTEAEGAVDHAPDYFDKLKSQLSEMLNAEGCNSNCRFQISVE